MRVDGREGGECVGREWVHSIAGATVSAAVWEDLEWSFCALSDRRRHMVSYYQCGVVISRTSNSTFKGYLTLVVDTHRRKRSHSPRTPSKLFFDAFLVFLLRLNRGRFGLSYCPQIVSAPSPLPHSIRSSPLCASPLAGLFP